MIKYNRHFHLTARTKKDIDYNIITQYDKLEYEYKSPFSSPPFLKKELKMLLKLGLFFEDIPRGVYNKGFIHGYNSFQSDLKEFNSLNVTTIYDCAIREIPFFSTNTLIDNSKEKLHKETCYEIAVLTGEQYKAWEIIFKYQEEFKKLFEKPKGETKPKITEKHYALLHYILIKLGKEQKFEKNKSKAVTYYKNKYKLKTSGEQMYKFIHNDWGNSETAIAKIFKDDYKDVIRSITDNPDVLSYLRSFPKL